MTLLNHSVGCGVVDTGMRDEMKGKGDARNDTRSAIHIPLARPHIPAIALAWMSGRNQRGPPSVFMPRSHISSLFCAPVSVYCKGKHKHGTCKISFPSHPTPVASADNPVFLFKNFPRQVLLFLPSARSRRRPSPLFVLSTPTHVCARQGAMRTGKPHKIRLFFTSPAPTPVDAKSGYANAELLGQGTPALFTTLSPCKGMRRGMATPPLLRTSLPLGRPSLLWPCSGLHVSGVHVRGSA